MGRCPTVQTLILRHRWEKSYELPLKNDQPTAIRKLTTFKGWEKACLWHARCSQLGGERELSLVHLHWLSQSGYNKSRNAPVAHEEYHLAINVFCFRVMVPKFESILADCQNLCRNFLCVFWMPLGGSPWKGIPALPQEKGAGVALELQVCTRSVLLLRGCTELLWLPQPAFPCTWPCKPREGLRLRSAGIYTLQQAAPCWE